MGFWVGAGISSPIASHPMSVSGAITAFLQTWALPQGPDELVPRGQAPRPHTPQHGQKAPLHVQAERGDCLLPFKRCSLSVYNLYF